VAGKNHSLERNLVLERWETNTLSKDHGELGMKRSHFTPALLVLLVGTLAGSIFVWQHGALFALIRWPWMPAVSGRAYLYYALKQQDGFVLARAPKGPDGQPLAQPQTLLAFGNGFGLTPSDSVASLQLSPDGNYLAIDAIHEYGEQVFVYDIQNMRMSLAPDGVSGNFLHWLPGGNGHTFLYRPMMPLGPNAPLDGDTWNPGLWSVDAQSKSYQNIDIGESAANIIDAAPSPDGSKIVYSTTTGLGMGSTTFVMNRDGSDRAQLFSLKDAQRAVAGLFTWSSNGKRIAYERLADSETPFLVAGLWVMDQHGGQQVHVADTDGGHGYMPSWSPDGKQLAFVQRTNLDDQQADKNEQALRSAIGVVDLATLQVQQVAAEQQTGLPININPVWGTQGKQITFTALSPTNRDPGGTRRYWSASVPSVAVGAEKQAHVTPLSMSITQVVAAS
jgi:Tol biopolymer transport system component